MHSDSLGNPIHPLSFPRTFQVEVAIQRGHEEHSNKRGWRELLAALCYYIERTKIFTTLNYFSDQFSKKFINSRGGFQGLLIKIFKEIKLISKTDERLSLSLSGSRRR